MPTYSPEQALARPTGRAPLWGEGLLAAALWLLGGLFTLTWPDAGRRWPFSEGWALAQFTLGGGLLLLALSYRYWRARGARVLHAGRVAGAAAGAVCCLGRADRQNCRVAGTILRAAAGADRGAARRLAAPARQPAALPGAAGARCAAGYQQRVHHRSGHRLVATDWLLGASGVTSAGAGAVHRAAAAVPVYFSSSFGASVFLIALSTWFPVTVLTWSGVMGIDKAWYDVARTLGASQRFLILRVAIPAALPNVFVGLFMGLGASFSVLIVAEMVGVKSGIGFYLQWAQGWAAYPNMYAALLVMALLCSGLISGLFMLRDRLLSWQRGGMQW